VGNRQENLSFSILILGSVFSDHVVFDGDTIIRKADNVKEFHWCLTRLVQWCYIWQLTISTKKCNVLCCGSMIEGSACLVDGSTIIVLPSTDRPMPSIILPQHNTLHTICTTKCVRDVGVLDDSDLKFTEHINIVLLAVGMSVVIWYYGVLCREIKATSSWDDSQHTCAHYYRVRFPGLPVSGLQTPRQNWGNTMPIY